MKLRLPTLLCTALLACMACATTVHAATYLAEGVNQDDLEGSERFYDGGKGRDWDDFERAAYSIYTANGNDLSIFGDLASSITVPEYQSRLDCSKLYNDSGHCWAYTSSNMLQYWQTYYGVFAKKAGENKDAPVHGQNYDRTYLTELGGTQSLKLNKLFYDNFTGTVGGGTNKAFGWYLYGENAWGGQVSANSAPGYFRQYFSHYNDTHKTVNGQNLSSLAAMSDSIKQAFGYTQQNGEWVQTTKGQIMHLELKAGSSSHAITCYGFETDADGNIKALYVVNSDDGKHELVKVYTKFVEYGYYDYRLELHYDEECSGYNTYNAWAVTGWSNLNTPEVLKNMLAEYENGKMTWMGNLESWTSSSAVAADVNVLPTDETGWMTWAGSDTQHAGYYNSYCDISRGVVFNDEAASGTVNVAEDIVTPTMEVNNTNLAYTFDGGETTRSITVDEFSKTGSGSLTFSHVKLTAGSVTVASDVTFDELHVTGTLSAANNRIHANKLTLDGDATIGSLGNDSSEDGIGTTDLTITGGKTTINNWWAWTGLKSLSMSDTAQLEVGASLRVSGNISSTSDTLPASGTASIRTTYALNVGTEGDATTGKVDLAGNITAGAYIKILGDATVTGNITTSKEYIDIGGVADIGGDLNAGSGYVVLRKGGDVDGTITGSTITLKDSTSIGRVANDANLVVSGGTATVEYTQDWTNVGNLSLSDQARLDVGASVKVAGNISTTSTTATLAAGSTAGINARYCIEVGTLENGSVKAGTGDATLTGDLTAQAYIKIHGNADVSGNITSSGDGGDRSIAVGGNAKVSGNIQADHGVTIGGNLTMAADKTLTAQTLEVKGSLGLNEQAPAGAKASLSVAESMTLGGNVSHVSLTAKNLTIGSVGGSPVELNEVNIKLTGGELTLNDVIVTGNSTFTPNEGETQVTLNATNVTFVLDGSNSDYLAAQAQPFALMSLDPLVETEVAPKTLVINSDMLENLNINGSVTLDLSHYAQEIQQGGYDNVTLAFADEMNYTGDSTVQATLDGKTFATAAPTGDNMPTFSVSQLNAVPEPTTATLSLLALAALAARRRRK